MEWTDSQNVCVRLCNLCLWSISILHWGWLWWQRWSRLCWKLTFISAWDYHWWWWLSSKVLGDICYHFLGWWQDKCGALWTCPALLGPISVRISALRVVGHGRWGRAGQLPDLIDSCHHRVALAVTNECENTASDSLSQFIILRLSTHFHPNHFMTISHSSLPPPPLTTQCVVFTLNDCPFYCQETVCLCLFVSSAGFSSLSPCQFRSTVMLEVVIVVVKVSPSW